MLVVRDLSTSDMVFKFVFKNTLKHFPHVECLPKEQKDCIKNVVNRRCLCNPSNRFWKEYNLSTVSMSNIFKEWTGRCHFHDHGGLSSSPNHNERQSWTLEKNQNCSYNTIGIDEEATLRTGKCEIVCKWKYCCSVFSISNWKLLWHIWPPNSKQEVTSHKTFCFMKFQVPVAQMCQVESLHLVPPF